MRLVYWALALAAVWAALAWFASRSIYYPFRYPQGDWGERERLGAQDVSLRAADGVRLHGWWIPRPGARVATIHLHGNAGNVTHRAMTARAIVAAGSALLLLDYRGYGRSEGSPSERGLYADADAGFQHLLDSGWNPAQIVLHGESLGSAVAVDLASRRPCGGLLLEAPFSSARAVAGRVLPLLGPMLVRSYDSRAKIARSRAPLLVIHGDRDEVIPYDLGQELFTAANEPKEFWTVAGAGHNDLAMVAGPEYAARLRAFYDKVGAGR